jgi:hypothetical protein
MTVKIPGAHYRQLTPIWFKRFTGRRYAVKQRYLEQVSLCRLIGAGPQVLPLHDRSVDHVQPGRSRSLDHALITTQIKFCNF